MAKKKRRFSFRTILSILTIFLVAYVVYQNWPDILETLNHLQETNVFVLLLLIPEQLFMYYACGQIFFSNGFICFDSDFSGICGISELVRYCGDIEAYT